MTKAEELESRLIKFSIEVLQMINTLPKTEGNRVYGHQLIRSSSSIGANYAEARYAHTRQDFAHILNISRKESNETFYWLRLLSELNKSHSTEINKLLDESNQILKIFISSTKTTKGGFKNGQ